MAGRRSSPVPSPGSLRRDRKSTRLNSSHSQISYAVFCLKKNNTGAVRQTSVTERGALVDAPAHRADDELDDVEELVLVDELDVGQHDLAGHLDVDVVVAVDHDLRHAVVADERLVWTELLAGLGDVAAWDPD